MRLIYVERNQSDTATYRNVISPSYDFKFNVFQVRQALIPNPSDFSSSCRVGIVFLTKIYIENKTNQTTR